MTFKIDMRYTNGKIYKLVSNVTGDVYYGSTTQKLSYRLAEHKRNYKRYLKGKYGYTTSYKIIETGDYDIHLVENYSCLCKKQLESIERVYIENYKCINKVVVGRIRKETMKADYEKHKKKRLKYAEEYRNNNLKKVSECKKKWYQKNKENILNKIKEKFDCECGGKYTRAHKVRHLKTKKHQNYLNTC